MSPDPWLCVVAPTSILMVEIERPEDATDEEGTRAEIHVHRGGQGLWVATMARAGARIVVDDVFLGGAASQQRWRDALDGLDVLWVGVRCDPETAAGREIARGDRVSGMAKLQALSVHEGVAYDVEVDTTNAEPLACARAIARTVTSM